MSCSPTAAAYDIIAIGAMETHLTQNPTFTFWRTTNKKTTKFAVASHCQPFNTQVAFGSESHITINRVGDLCYYMYLRVVLPGIVATDAAEGYPGIAGTGQFPKYMDDGGACNPAAKMDEAALLPYLPSNYDDYSDANKAAALKSAKDLWRKEHYGAGTELGCCSEPDADCPDNSCPELGDCWAHYCNDVGHFMVNHCKLIIGGGQIDQLWGTFLFAWEELSGKSGRRLTELTGRRYTRSQLVCDSREERELYIPLPFYFTQSSGSALPLASLAYHGVQLTVDFSRLEQLIVVSKSDVIVRHARTGLGLTNNDLKADLDITYILLDQAEREKFAESHFDQLIVEHQSKIHVDSKAMCRIPLAFAHPTIELIFCVRREAQARCNNWGNLSGVDGRDPIVSADLLLNTGSRHGKKSATWLRGVSPLQHHSNLPEAYVYVFSFALDPENTTQNSGHCNFSRIDNVELAIDMQPALANEQYTVFVYSRCWNVLKISGGVLGKAFQ